LEKKSLDHYKRIAENYGDKATSTIKDQFIRNSEVSFILNEIQRYKNEVNRSLVVLDVGCGNGYVLSVLSEKFPESQFYGVEFTKELFEIANGRNLRNVTFLNGDCRDKNFFAEKVDIIITERVLINIFNPNERILAIKNFYGLLKKGGRYLLIESFVESWENLNKARKEMVLDTIPQSPQNRYIDEDLIKTMVEIGFSEIKGVFPPNYLSTYFYLTRIFHHLFRPKGGKKEGSEFVKFFNEVIGPSKGNYSPIQFRVFENK
jgi:ubiquinone/menaquinone biosynthesis C-methylase UbiE